MSPAEPIFKPPTLRPPILRRALHPYTLGVIGVVSLSFGLRFWHLSRFNALVFDEVYFAKFAQAYLTQTPSFDAHPPLGKYFIALGIWVSTHVPLFAPFLKGASVAITSNIRLFPLSYRWMNALVGSCVPLLVIGLVHTLSRQTNNLPNRHLNQSKPVTFAVLASAFVAIDGLFITESRYALINIYMVFFGLLGHWLWLQASFFWIAGGSKRRGHGYRLLAGVALGGAIATKWNGLGYVLSLLIWEVWRTREKARKTEYFWVIFYAILVPAFIYCLIWLPHLAFTNESLGSINLMLLTFHRELSNGGHQACAPWFTWPLLIKPISYWYEESGGLAYTVNNVGNPALWWLASAATFLLLLEQGLRLIQLIRRKSASSPERSLTDNLRAYLLISYAANWLPWMLVGRCTFIYLYMPAAIYSFMVLAWLLSEWLHERPSDTLEQAKGQAKGQARIMGWLMVGAIALAFFFWLPLSLGLPLTPEELQLRWWLKSWI